MPVVAQFPLGSVLFPSMVLPLHVFEPRDQALARDVLAGDGEFGVPLIVRGSEVGGGDVRSDVGTMARVLEARELPDGRWALVAVGTRRFRVERWLADDPYPRAEVEDWPDEPSTSGLDRYGEVVAVLRRALALSAELGDETAPSTVELTDDPELGSFQVAAVAPLGPLDKQALLLAPSAGQRLDVAGRALAELTEVLTLRMHDDGEGDPT